MRLKTRFHSKVLKGLIRALDDEKRHLRRYYWFGKLSGFLGGLLFGLALFSALRGGDTSVASLVALGAAGGLLFGLAIFFGTSVRQWADHSRVLAC
jgi:AAA+ ATPase superfamily predicted ATPase